MKIHYQNKLSVFVGAFLVVHISGCSSLLEQPELSTVQSVDEDSVQSPLITDEVSASGLVPDTKPEAPEPVIDGEVTVTALTNVVIAAEELTEEPLPTIKFSDITEASDTDLDIVSQIENTPAPVIDIWQHLRNGFQLEYPEKNNSAVDKFERWYASHPKYFERLADRAYWLLPYVSDEVEKRGMPAEIALLPAIESAFRHEATSRSNAVGLWQMIGATGRRFGLRQDWWMDGRRDMVQSTRAALDYLQYLWREFDGDWTLALAGYNTGEGNVRRQIRKNRAAEKSTDYWSLSLRQETEEYVPKLLAFRNVIINPEKYNIKLRSIPNEPTLAVIDARVPTDLTVAASLIPISSKQIHSFNLGYKRGVTPPAGPHNIVVPIKYAEVLLAGLNELTLQQRMRWARHQVRKGEYLGRIARKHGVTVESIMLANQLSSNLIQPGQELKIPVSTGHYKYASATAGDIKVQDGDKIYTIKSGDTLWKISQNFGPTLSKLLRWNGLTKKTLLHPGQQIIIGRSS